MTTFLVDADWIIDCLHGRDDARDVLIQLATDGLAVSIISYGELYQGAHYARDPRGALRGLRLFLQGMKLLSLNRAIVERFGILRGDLKQRGLTVGDSIS